jgi:hypothetical protein
MGPPEQPAAPLAEPVADPVPEAERPAAEAPVGETEAEADQLGLF